jgi:uncharacterized protein YecT (DUF1311 family)
MTGTQCAKCGLSRADAAVRIQRCGEIACPLRARQSTDPRHAVALIVVIVVVIALLVAGIMLVARRHRATADGAIPFNSGEQSPFADGGADTGSESGGGWMSGLWKSKPEQAPEPAATSTPMIQPSFDCATARTATTQLICGDTELAILDRNANLLFLQALARSRDPRALYHMRAAWLAERAKLPPDHNALLASYRAWAAELAR